jgi:[ribosomal protein S18]-alanine N-acetyltransferase
MIVLHAGFQLRTMTDDDLPAVVAIENATQPTPWTEQVFRDCFNSHYDCRVIERDGDIAGFAVLSSVLDEVHLLNIAVAPALQRRGLAWAVIRELIADYRQRSMEFLYLEVRASNSAARALYERLGFQVTGERKNYYRTLNGRENAILMMLTL